MNSLLNLDVDRACMQDYRASRGGGGDREQPLDQLHASGAQKEYVPQHEVEARITLEQALWLLSTPDSQGMVRSHGAVLALKPLLNHRIEDYLSDCYSQRAFPVRLSMQAQSLAAYAYYKTYVLTPKALREAMISAVNHRHWHDAHFDGIVYPDNPLFAIISAGKHAAVAASMQFLSPVVFIVGFALRDLAERLELDVWHFKSYVPLWRALERYELEMFEDYYLPGGRSGQTMILPGQTICAARGCMSSVGLTPCSGNCTWQWKPWYCSLTCQERHWASEGHRDACRPPRMRALSELPPTITLDQHTRGTLLRMLTPTATAKNIEIVPEDENPVDTRNGVIGLSWKVSSPYVLGETVQFVVRHYYA